MKKNEYILNYSGSVNGSRTVSSTMFIKDEDNNLVGMLCINHNIANESNILFSIANALNISQEVAIVSKKSSISSTETPEIFTNDIGELISSILEQLLPIGRNGENLSQKEKIAIIEQLNNHGIFSIKGAITEVAKQLYSSEPTIYRYLKKIKK